MEDQQVGKRILAAHSSQSVRLWSMVRCFEKLNGTRCRHPSEARSKFAVVIPNRILWCLPIRRGFPKLLRNPGIGGRSCHSHVDYASRFEFDDDERQGRSKEEISHV